MKTAKEYLAEHPTYTRTSGHGEVDVYQDPWTEEQIKTIQLDAWKQGMLDAAQIVRICAPEVAEKNIINNYKNRTSI